MNWDKVQKSLQDYGVSRVNTSAQNRMAGNMNDYGMNLIIGDICIAIATAIREGLKK